MHLNKIKPWKIGQPLSEHGLINIDKWIHNWLIKCINS